MADKVKQGIDVLICGYRLVQTGSDLVDFPKNCWFGMDYSVYTMRRVSRRSWRIGQTRPVKVVFMACRSTLQGDALKLAAKKLQSSLAAYGDDGDDLMLAPGPVRSSAARRTTLRRLKRSSPRSRRPRPPRRSPGG